MLGLKEFVYFSCMLNNSDFSVSEKYNINIIQTISFVHILRDLFLAEKNVSQDFENFLFGKE